MRSLSLVETGSKRSSITAASTSAPRVTSEDEKSSEVNTPLDKMVIVVVIFSLNRVRVIHM